MKINIFTDGSSRGNPGPGGWGAVVVMADRVIELGGRDDMTTNNRMEITAALRALERVASDVKDVSQGGSIGAIVIHTDSSYLINGITKWVHGWQKKGWITTAKEEVLNRDLWEALVDVVSQIKSRLKNSSGEVIEWKYVGGHIGIAGNERCDVIATEFADREMSEGDLYDGPLAGYSIKNILDISIDTAEVSKKSAEKSEKNSRSRAKAYSYVSQVGGKVYVDKSWAECEARVKGKSGVRFKKSLNAVDERAIVVEFS